MKIRYILLLFLLIHLPVKVLIAQSGYNVPVIPLQHNHSPIFGSDVILNNQPTQNQQNNSICSAFNGWLFAAYSYQNNSGVYVVLLKSTDSGISWNVLMEDVVPFQHYIITKTSLTTSGNNTSNMKVFLGMIMLDTIYNKGHPWVGRYNVVPFTGEVEILEEGNDCHDLELGNDFISPASGSNPNSFGVLYSKTGTIDTVVFRSSSNGLTLTDRRVVASSSGHLGKVKLSFGLSATFNTGRYFAVWEEKATETDLTGHIFTSHTEPNFDSPFTTPVCLDCLNPSTINLGRNPVIASQYGVMDNDSLNLTTVILFEKYNQSSDNFDIAGYFNQKSTQTSFFKPLSFTNPGHKNIQPSTAFNPYDSTFILTWFDSTLTKLPFLNNGMNFSNPNNWHVISDGYNDDNNISSPKPIVSIDFSTHSGNSTWISDRQDGKGEILFDSYYNTYTGISNNIPFRSSNDLRVFPNPCSSNIVIGFELIRQSRVNISLVNQLGRLQKNLTNQLFVEGRQLLYFDISDVPSGSYICTVTSSGFSLACKMIVIK